MLNLVRILVLQVLSAVNLYQGAPEVLVVANLSEVLVANLSEVLAAVSLAEASLAEANLKRADSIKQAEEVAHRQTAASNLLALVARTQVEVEDLPESSRVVQNALGSLAPHAAPRAAVSPEDQTLVRASRLADVLNLENEGLLPNLSRKSILRHLPKHLHLRPQQTLPTLHLQRTKTLKVRVG